MKYYEYQIIKLLTLLEKPISYENIWDIIANKNHIRSIDGDTIMQVLDDWIHSEYVTEDHGIYKIAPKGKKWLDQLSERTKL